MFNNPSSVISGITTGGSALQVRLAEDALAKALEGRMGYVG